MNGRRVLVTGGTGFIGSELVRLLALQGAHVRVVDNLINGRRENLEGVTGPGSVELVVADIRATEQLFELLHGVDLVYHLACLGVRHSIHSPWENHEVNASGTLGLLQAARSAEVGRLVYVSTSEVYGTAQTVPMTENHPTLPLTVYGASKLAGECYARAFFQTYGFATVVVRPFNAFGPRCHHEGDSGEVIPRFLLRALAGQPLVIFGDGSQTRDFTDVSDTARGILEAGLVDAAVGQTINLGSQQEISILHLAEEVRRVTGRHDARITHDEPRPGDVLRLFAEGTRAQDLLGFRPSISLQQGLIRLRDWYLAQPQSPEELLQFEVLRNWEA